jgi:DNA gyrase/topoisomerase IV subunit A
VEDHPMDFERPDLSQIPTAVQDYIKQLEAEIARLRSPGRPSRTKPPAEEDLPSLAEPLPPEPPTTIQVITLTASGLAKRTPRHLYVPQRRGGMGIFDLDSPEDDPPAILILADIDQYLLLFTSLARAFRLPVSQIAETPVRGRGTSIITRSMNLQPDERLVTALRDEARGAVALVSAQGMVRHLRHHIFGEYMKPGTVLFDTGRFGPLAAACRTPGDGDLFIATRQGKGIRFSEKLVPPQGGAGIRLEKSDTATAVAAANEDSRVFLVDAIGRGTLRIMSGFAANKSAGGGGKIAMNTDCLIAALNADELGDVFMISRWSKIIRFSCEEVPVKEGVVQGVNCMALRADEVVAVGGYAP